MAAFEDERREKFARGLAEDLPAWRAWEAAGYGRNPHRARTRAAKAEMIARVRELRLARLWGGSRDLAPVIDECMRLAQIAGEQPTGAALIAARGLLAEAARLKQMLPMTGNGAQNARWVPPEPVMDHEAWMARFAPREADAP